MTTGTRNWMIWLAVVVTALGDFQVPVVAQDPVIQNPLDLSDAVADAASAKARLLQGDAEAQIAAAVELGAMGPYAYSAVDAIVGRLQSDNPAVQYECIAALGEIGPIAHDAADGLTPFLQHPEPLFQSAALESLRRIGTAGKDAESQIRKLCLHPDPSVASAAVRCLLKITPGIGLPEIENKQNTDDIIRNAVPMLVQALGDVRAEVRNEAAVALIEIGESAVPHVSAQLSHAEPAVRRKACEILGRAGRVAADAVPAIQQCLEDPDELVVRAAITALGGIQSSPETVLPQLGRLLLSPSVAVRITAVRAIAGFGTVAVDLTPQVLPLLSDGNTVLRASAAETLGRIGGGVSTDVIQALVKALADPNGAVTVRAANALSQIGGPAVPALIPLLSDEGYRSLAVEMLGEMGAGAEPAVPAMVQLLGNDDRELRREVFIALATLGPHAKSATPALLKILQDPAAGPSRAGAAYVLAHLGEMSAVPTLTQLVNAGDAGADELTLLSAAWALAMLQPHDAATAERVLPLLLQATTSENELIRREAMAAIGGFGQAAKSAQDILLQHAAGDSVAAVRAEALHGLAQIKSPAELTLPIALAALNDADPLVRNTARYLLGRIGAEAHGAVPQLRETLRRGDEFERVVSVWALVRIAPSKETFQAAVPLMLTALKHVNPRVRVEAAEVLGDIGAGRPDVISALEAVRDDEDSSVQEAVNQALKKLQTIR